MKRLAIVFLVLQILIILIAWRWLPPQVPLFFSRPWGQEQLTNPIGLFFLPAFSLVIFLVNLTLTNFLTKQEKLVSQILDSVAMVFSLLLLVALIQIIRLTV